VLAVGGAPTGPSSTIRASVQRKEAAASIDNYLGGDGCIGESLVDGEASGFEAAPAGFTRPVRSSVAFGERLRTFQLVEGGYSEVTAGKEARRCLNCDIRHYKVEVDLDACKACGYCKEVCGLGVFQKADSFNNRGYQPMEVINSDKCVGCRKCFFACPDFAISLVKAGEIE
jgi:NAD-dependent dihydropyrimidine dehydrogenase PreA subunit